MTFANEYASKEEVKKYNLDEIWALAPGRRAWKKVPGFRYSWTIDRLRNIFLIRIYSGREEEGNQQRFILGWHGEKIAVDLVLDEGSDGDLRAVPFHVVWNLVRLHSPPEFGVSTDELTNVLKEALTVFGYNGIRRQVPNTVVQFKF